MNKRIEYIAKKEGTDVAKFIEYINKGNTVIFGSKNHNNVSPIAIGPTLRTKVNASLGTSEDYCNPKEEIEKLRTVLKAGADTVMDLSTGGNVKQIRKKILNICQIPVGTVAIYRLAAECLNKNKNFEKLPPKSFLDTIEEQCNEGIDFITIHPAITYKSIELLQKTNRITKIVSRGGALTISWMLANKKENPFLENFDEILKICSKYNVVISLGNGLRPGCIHDGFDGPHIAEYVSMREVVYNARKKNVAIIVEGPGHLRIDKIASDIQMLKSCTYNVPTYYMGPIVTDIAPGYDHITSAIGAAIAAASGVEFLCYITPAEHLSLPTKEDVYLGVLTHRIAAHAGDIAKGISNADVWDNSISKARFDLKWEKVEQLAINSSEVKKHREMRPSITGACSICGIYCPMNKIKRIKYS